MMSGTVSVHDDAPAAINGNRRHHRTAKHVEASGLLGKELEPKDWHRGRTEDLAGVEFAA